MILGVVLAGGQSRRFGSDKALAQLDGRSLLLRAVDQLSGWCEAVVVAGRAEAPARAVPDWPRPGMGPLGGLAAALRLARDEGYEHVLSIGVDALGLPADLPARLAPAPACLAPQPVIGLWGASGAGVIEDLLLDHGARHSMRAFAERVSARLVEPDVHVGNVNTREDLAGWQDR